MVSVGGNIEQLFHLGDKRRGLELVSLLGQPHISVVDDIWSCSPVHSASWWRWDDGCILLVEVYDCNPLAKDSDSETSLPWEHWHAQVSSMNCLLTLAKSFLNTVGDSDGISRTMLHLACHRTHLPLVEFVLHLTFMVVDWNEEIQVWPYFSVFFTAWKSILAALLVKLFRHILSQDGKVSHIKTHCLSLSFAVPKVRM